MTRIRGALHMHLVKGREKECTHKKEERKKKIILIKISCVFYLFAQQTWHKNSSFTKIQISAYITDLFGSIFNVSSSHWETLHYDDGTPEPHHNHTCCLSDCYYFVIAGFRYDNYGLAVIVPAVWFVIVCHYDMSYFIFTIIKLRGTFTVDRMHDLLGTTYTSW